MSYLDTKYINLISSHLDKFKQLPGSQKFNFRCYYCGDSEKNSSKARGYLLPDKKNDSYFYYCHNCGKKSSFKYVLRDIDSGLYQEYLREHLSPEPFKIDENILEHKTETHDELLYKLPTIDQLTEPHFAREYCKKRRIPKKWFSVLRYTDNFKEFTNSIIPNKFSHTSKKDSRLVIPFHDYDGKLIGFQGRALYQTNLRYYSIMIDENARKIFGLDRIDTNKPYYICEGPIDSLFIDNCLAVAGADMISALRFLPNTGNATVILDNQPRNKEVLKEYRKVIEYGVKVFFWPEHINAKDVNDAILEGFTRSELMSIIDDNSYSGLRARAEFAAWNKLR